MTAIADNQEQSLLRRKKLGKWNEIFIGDFRCNDNNLTSLDGAPYEIRGDFHCRNNKLTSLDDGPIVISGDYDCSYNELTSLRGSPKHIRSSFYCHNNNLTSIEGAPTEIGHNFYCHWNPITSLTGIGDYFKNGYIANDLIIPKSVTSHVLGILLIPRLNKIFTTGPLDIEVQPISRVIVIINRHLESDRDILECQEELRTVGLREYGKL